jgi:hypothetical protein
MCGADAEPAAAAGRVRLDFSSIRRRRELADASSPAQREALHAKYRAELEERAGKLARAAPNLKALDQFAAVKVGRAPSGLFVSPAAHFRHSRGRRGGRALAAFSDVHEGPLSPMLAALLSAICMAVSVHLRLAVLTEVVTHA